MATATGLEDADPLHDGFMERMSLEARLSDPEIMAGPDTIPYGGHSDSSHANSLVRFYGVGSPSRAGCYRSGRSRRRGRIALSGLQSKGAIFLLKRDRKIQSPGKVGRSVQNLL
jgi:hypothetical protein